MTDTQIVEIMREIQKDLHGSAEVLNAIRSELANQNSFRAQTLSHFVDFLVIFAADVSAAVAVLVTFESWRERDHQNMERAHRVLAKMGPNLSVLIPSLERTIPEMMAAPSTVFSMQWGGIRSAIHNWLEDPDLSRGALDWEYPEGETLKDAFHEMRDRIRGVGTTTGNLIAEVQEILKAARRVEQIQNDQKSLYVGAKISTTWRRFLSWIFKFFHYRR